MVLPVFCLASYYQALPLQRSPRDRPAACQVGTPHWPEQPVSRQVLHSRRIDCRSTCPATEAQDRMRRASGGCHAAVGWDLHLNKLFLRAFVEALPAEYRPVSRAEVLRPVQVPLFNSDDRTSLPSVIRRQGSLAHSTNNIPLTSDG
jgi:hypothetical protein